MSAFQIAGRASCDPGIFRPKYLAAHGTIPGTMFKAWSGCFAGHRVPILPSASQAYHFKSISYLLFTYDCMMIL